MKDPFGTTFNPFSSSFREKLNDVGEYAIDWNEKGDDLQARLNELNPLATMPYGPDKGQTRRRLIRGLVRGHRFKAE